MYLLENGVIQDQLGVILNIWWENGDQSWGNIGSGKLILNYPMTGPFTPQL